MRKWKSAVLASGLSAFGLGCVAENASAPLHVTSARVATTHAETQAEREIGSGDIAEALATTERGEWLTPTDPLAHYDRAVALEQAGRTTEASSEFLDAAARFGGGDRRGKALSIYGRAHLLASAGRCGEAKGAYEAYAAFVRVDSPAQADMALRYAADCVEPMPADPVTEGVATAVVAGDYARALSLAPAAGGGAWLSYDRAVALASLGRIDEAIVDYEAAERAFGGEQRERSLAIYGRAHTLAGAHRCLEAKEAYDEYASLVRSTSPKDAQTAWRYAADCHAVRH